jgi:2-dehydropantoate 2-reductase
MRILIVGAGGIGGYFGGRLAESGCDVTFLVRPARKKSLDERGLRVISPLGNIERPVSTKLLSELNDEFDVVFIACKSYHLEQVVDDLKSRRLQKAYYLPLLNGLRHISVLDEVFGAEKVLGGLCRIAATLTPDGEIVHLGNFGEIRIGSRHEAGAHVVDELAASFRKAHVNVLRADDIVYELWSKFVDLSTLAAATCTMRAPIGIINRAVGGSAFILALINEARSVSAASGYQIHDEKLNSTRRVYSDESSALTSSMLRDLESGGHLEAEHIVGDMCDRGRAVGVDTPFFDIARAHLWAHELRFPAGASGG